ncbi:DUF305 domain-containing protein [Micromonospora sp. DR5-3]|uniref:DUF305 domain-containing protein n=1 Tax=unclassified Micromonospora TaxID=2617518 RepID=UPI0011D49409|nr:MULTISPECIES: DUF305 domain-containing protein [unclassified Micromonospora]MCW3816135.1 DUF305 domain-containing protein [Micromonospora sp. DR5-3]TYC22137.1 DUF305 domain-containing protein [Micromonospora sp. MP36]
MHHLVSAVLLLVLLPTAGCAPDPARPAPAPSAAADTPTSGIDVLFLTMMATHTEQTLEIVRRGLARTTDPQIRTLIAAIDVTETDELATMRGWLRDAGPSAVAAAARHDHSGHSDAVAGLARLRAAPTGDVDRVLLEVLSAHQRTAAGLARAQVRAGTSERIRELARRIERSRSAEVELMAKLAAQPRQ